MKARMNWRQKAALRLAFDARPVPLYTANGWDGSYYTYKQLRASVFKFECPRCGVTHKDVYVRLGKDYRRIDKGGRMWWTSVAANNN